MARISWTVEASVGTVTHDGPTISDEQMQRFLDWVWDEYPQTSADKTRLPRSAANMVAALYDWGRAQWVATKSDVLKSERRAAVQAAHKGVKPWG